MTHNPVFQDLVLLAAALAAIVVPTFVNVIRHPRRDANPQGQRPGHGRPAIN